MFGVLVPDNTNKALAHDKENGNNLWQESIDKEMKQILDFKTFKILDAGEEAPKGYQQIPMRLIYAVKHDGRRKARLVAGGHVTAPPNEEVYSSVVQPESVRLVMFLAAANNLDIMGGGHKQCIPTWSNTGEDLDTCRARIWTRHSRPRLNHCQVFVRTQNKSSQVV